jgi:hypothetical protein
MVVIYMLSERRFDVVQKFCDFIISAVGRGTVLEETQQKRDSAEKRPGGNEKWQRREFFSRLPFRVDSSADGGT